MSERYVCIHGHFYQPPRENPWLEEVELQDSAYPYHDWNEKITAECYSRNAASRILDKERKIIDIVNNYLKISFNFGPTLISWLQKNKPQLYHIIIEADQETRKVFSGHGAAIAQVYDHIIMPLANSRDKRTQIIWGIRDFENSFGRKPEGMWLPETAVDLETLDIMSEQGIKFTILAPRQARRVCKIGETKWSSVETGKIDTTIAYRCNLASGRNISLFFYNDSVAKAVAYEGLLKSGEDFAKKLSDIFERDSSKPQLANIASDGETYGHHHRYGDMALAYCIHRIESDNLAKITVYGEFLEKFPPTYEVEIIENTSWSCVHGIERWRSNCGCNYGKYPGKQQWRQPLREAMDSLCGKLAEIYESRMSGYTKDVWGLRDRYIDVILNRDRANVEQFLANNVNPVLSLKEKVEILRLLEIQRHSILMYTSCGWFFDDIAGIEAVQVMQYAARAMQLAKKVADANLESDFVKILQRAPANAENLQNGAEVYEKFIRPTKVDLNRVCVHFAVSSLFEDYPQRAKIFCYTAEREFYDLVEAGLQTLAVGRVKLSCDVTLEEHDIDFAVLHFGNHNLGGSVIERLKDARFNVMHKQIKEAFLRGDTTEVIRLMNIHFNGQNYSLWHLFKDEQRHILDKLMVSTWQEIEASFRQIYEHNYTVMQAMSGMHIPLPKALTTPMEFVINRDILKEIRDEKMDMHRLRQLVDESRRLNLQLDTENLRFEAGKKISQLLSDFAKLPKDAELLKLTESTLRVLAALVMDIDLYEAQNICFYIARQVYPEMHVQTSQEANRWVEYFTHLANCLSIRLP